MCRLRRQQARPGGVWRLGEVVANIKCRKFWQWRAVGQNGIVLDEVLHRRRNKKAAKRLLFRLMKRHGFVPKHFRTDRLRCYNAAKHEIALGFKHRSHKGLNNRAINSHLSFRKRERAIQGFRSPRGSQRFMSIHSDTRDCLSVPTRRRSVLGSGYHCLGTFDA